LWARKCCPFIGIAAWLDIVPRFKQTIPIDDYVLDILMRDLLGHDQKPAAYVVYLYLYGQAARRNWKPVPARVRALADATGLSKSAVQTALAHLRRRQLISSVASHSTATPRHRVLRHWR
jgi:DNA-binding MarR family transcriptional regulator